MEQHYTTTLIELCSKFIAKIENAIELFTRFSLCFTHNILMPNNMPIVNWCEYRNSWKCEWMRTLWHNQYRWQYYIVGIFTIATVLLLDYNTVLSSWFDAMKWMQWDISSYLQFEVRWSQSIKRRINREIFPRKHSSNIHQIFFPNQV